MKATLKTLLTLAALPLAFLLIALFFLPYVLVTLTVIKVRDWRLSHRLQAAGRTVSWSDVEKHLESGAGTLVIEQAQKQSLRFWWTPDDVPRSCPLTIPSFDELNLFYPDPKQPFVGWCFQRYLSPETGTALLTHARGIRLPRGFVSPDFFTSRYPAARVVATTLMTRPFKPSVQNLPA